MRRVIAFPSGRQRATREATAASRTPLREARGGSLVDVLIGLAVAMLTLAVVYEVFLAADTVRRNAASVADAQGNAAFALFALASQIGNAGAGWASAAQWLDACPAEASIAATLRPISVLVTDGGAADPPDTIVVRQTFAHALALPASIATAAPAGDRFLVESPDAFVIGDRVIAITRAGNCATTTVTAVSAPVAGIV